jgi:hypothetical protein
MPDAANQEINKFMRTTDWQSGRRVTGIRITKHFDLKNLLAARINHDSPLNFFGNFQNRF